MSPIGIVSDDDFNLEVSKCIKLPETKPIPAVEIITPEKGRGHNPNVPDGLRKIIGEESNINGRQEALTLARSFGISDSSVSAYANGATSTASYNETKPSLKDHINRAKERISKKARGKLIAALDGITPEKLKEAPLRVLSQVTRDMSAVVRDMEPAKETESNPNNRPTFVFYSPTFKKESDFNTIILNE